MTNYILTKKAVADLSEIWEYTFEVWSEKQADKYYFQLLSFCDELAADPNLGKSYAEVDKDIFGFKASHHIIFYTKLKKNQILIVRFLHNRMDLKSRIQD